MNISYASEPMPPSYAADVGRWAALSAEQRSRGRARLKSFISSEVERYLRDKRMGGLKKTVYGGLDGRRTYG